VSPLEAVLRDEWGRLLARLVARFRRLDLAEDCLADAFEAAGRTPQGRRRHPGLIAGVLLAEYLTLALLADVLGLVIARLVGPAIVNPTASMITKATGPTVGTIAFTTVVALAVATLTTLGPTVRALRTETVAALADVAHRPQHRPWLTRLWALLPTPLLLGLRLIARRPGRAVLHASNTTSR
jgi:putative ABC transport system permease protein